MTSTPIRAAATAILGAVLGGGLACTAIMTPRDDVDRCSNKDDCPSTGEARFTYECRFEPIDLDSLNVDKVCVPAFAPQNCAVPMNPEEPYADLHGKRKRQMYYRACSETPGMQGCRPAPGESCQPGLTPRPEDNICDDDDPNTPPAFGFYMADFDPERFRGQDVKDQYCRNFYCDDEFVCDTDNQCVRCDPNKKLGEGGCGEIYSNGKPMCTYHRGSEIDAQCRGKTVPAGDAAWGDCSDEMQPGDDDTTDDTSDPTDPTSDDETGTTGGDETTGGAEDTGTTGSETTTG
jgi:hypothetical protein